MRHAGLGNPLHTLRSKSNRGEAFDVRCELSASSLAGHVLVTGLGDGLLQIVRDGMPDHSLVGSDQTVELGSLGVSAMNEAVQKVSRIDHEFLSLAGKGRIDKVCGALQPIFCCFVCCNDAGLFKAKHQTQGECVNEDVDGKRNKLVSLFRFGESKPLSSHCLDNMVIFLLGDGSLAKSEEKAEPSATTGREEKEAATDDLHSSGEDASTFADFSVRQLFIGALFTVAVDAFLVGVLVEVENLLEGHAYDDNPDIDTNLDISVLARCGVRREEGIQLTATAADQALTHR